MRIDWLFDRMRQESDSPALVRQGRTSTYAELLHLVDDSRELLDRHAVSEGTIVALCGDYTARACALLLALVERGTILVPLSSAAAPHRDEYLAICEAQAVIDFQDDHHWTLQHTGRQVTSALTRQLAAAGAPGLVLFSSGSTGKSKAALHAMLPLIDKHRRPRRPMRCITFLLLDHIGGINTLLYSLANGGTVVSLPARDPDVVCAAIAAHAVELLPTSPTFLNLMLMSGAHTRHDLSSLRLITYGTEVMPESTLQRLHAELPDVELKQTYGLSEVGILGSRSRDSGSLWVQVGGEGYETKVVDGILWIRARTAMLGYLNAPSPFDADGWLNTGDRVEQEGEYLRILGRASELINVGGQKVYPAEVESVLLQMPNVLDAAVYGEPNAITGQAVAARVNLRCPQDLASFKREMRLYCRGRLAAFKIPARVVISETAQYSSRFKRMRRSEAAG